MRALIAYQVVDHARSQRWVAPALVHLCLLAIVYATDAGPAYPAFAATAALLLPVAAWLTIAVLATEDDLVRQVTAVAVGGQTRVQAGLLLTAATAVAALAAASVTWGAVANVGLGQWRACAVGLVVHLAFGAVGVGLGALLGRPLVRRPGLAVLLGVGACLGAVAWPGSPVASVVREMHRSTVDWDAVQRGAGVMLLGAAIAVAVSLWAARRT